MSIESRAGAGYSIPPELHTEVRVQDLPDKKGNKIIVETDGKIHHEKKIFKYFLAPAILGLRVPKPFYDSRLRKAKKEAHYQAAKINFLIAGIAYSQDLELRQRSK